VSLSNDQHGDEPRDGRDANPSFRPVSRPNFYGPGELTVW
jgi:hypothetical protein